MLNNKKNYRLRKCFTVIELLVVISIILILTSMIIPAVSRARETAQTIKCSNNLRQVGLAHIMAADDNYGRVIAHNTEVYGSWVNYLHLDEEISEYAFRCPGTRVYFPARKGEGQYEFQPRIKANFIMNIIRENNYYGDWKIRGWQKEPSLSRAHQPGNTIFLTEIPTSFQYLNDNMDRTNAAEGIRYMGHPEGWNYNSQGKWDESSAGEKWLDSNTDHGVPITSASYRSYRRVGDHHSGGFNALMGDGSAHQMQQSNPVQWIAYEP